MGEFNPEEEAYIFKLALCRALVIAREDLAIMLNLNSDPSHIFFGGVPTQVDST